MCGVCGCGSDEVQIEGGHHHHHQHDHDHHHDHGHGHHHEPSPVQSIVINHHYHAGAQIFQYPNAPAAAHHEGAHSHPHHEHPSSNPTPPPHQHDSHAPGGRAEASTSGVTQERLVQLEKNILEKNDALARANRETFDAKRVFAVNIISSPGAGKTTLLSKTIGSMKARGRASAALIGDQQTSRDADRIRQTGAQALQINTGKGCHLDAHMVGHGADNLGLQEDSTLFIENVGNLVCPAGFDLGEHRRVVVISVTEGEDKPLKYPAAVMSSHLLLINKIDLLEHVDFDVDACERYARETNPGIEIIRISARTGEGCDDWVNWLENATTANVALAGV